MFQRLRILVVVCFFAVLIPSPLSARTCDKECARWVRGLVTAQANAYRQHLAELWFATAVRNGAHSTCVRGHESDSAGGYHAVNPSGRYRGAHQWDRATWDAASTTAGYPEWSQTPVDQVPWYVQELTFAAWAASHGDRPWLNKCLHTV